MAMSLLYRCAGSTKGWHLLTELIPGPSYSKRELGGYKGAINKSNMAGRWDLGCDVGSLTAIIYHWLDQANPCIHSELWFPPL